MVGQGSHFRVLAIVGYADNGDFCALDEVDEDC